MMEEKLLELGFNKRLNLLEKWNFRKLKDRVILKKNLPGCTLYFIIRRQRGLSDLINMQVKFSIFGKYHRLDFVKYLGKFAQHPFNYGDIGINFPEEKVEKVIEFLKLYVINPGITMELENIARENNTEHFYLSL